jgi:hypothetical protein
MRDDPLRTLLQQSHPVVPLTRSPPTARQLQRILDGRRQKRRRQTGLLVASVTLALLVAVTMRPAHGPGRATARRTMEVDTTRPAPRTREAESPVTADVKALRDQIAIQREIVNRLRAIKRQQQAINEYSVLSADLLQPSLDLELRYSQHRAAALALLHADRLREQGDRRGEALAEYSWIAEHYAGTPWAQQARERLDL